MEVRGAISFVAPRQIKITAQPGSSEHPIIVASADFIASKLRSFAREFIDEQAGQAWITAGPQGSRRDDESVCPDPRDALPTAEALMRSRFEAFRDGDAEWLLRSWHPSTRPAELDLSDNAMWRRLQIVETVGGGPADDEGIVEFRASWVRGDDHGVLHERSRFLREDGRWYYVDGDVE